MKNTTILKRVPEECAWSDAFHEYMDTLEVIDERIVFCGNRNFLDYGDSRLIAVVKGSYYDDDEDGLGYDYDTLDELRKLTGKRWEKTVIRGYSQSDWQDVYFALDEVSSEELRKMEDFYMGKYSEYRVNDDEGGYAVYVPHQIEWGGKKEICEYLGLNPDETSILIDDGYTKVWNYKEMAA